MSRKELLRVLAFLGVVVLLVDATPYIAYCAFQDHVGATILTSPRGQAPKVTAKPPGGSYAASATPWPEGTRYPFEFRFARLVSCPDRVTFNWGIGEGKPQTQTLKLDDCDSFTLRVKHVFASNTPRCVQVAAFLRDDEVARTSIRWPSGTPC